MADGRKRCGPPEDSSSSPARRRFAPPHLSRREAQKHDEVHRCCPHRARHDHDSRSYTPCSQDTGAYLRAAPCLMGRDQGRSPSPQSFSENERQKLPIYPGTWYLVYKYQVLLLCTWYLVRVLYFKAPPFAASYSCGNFLCAGLGSSPIYSSSLISVYKA